MSKLGVRITSALVATLFTYLIYHFFNIHGLVAITVLVILMGCQEYSRMVFNNATPLLKGLFIVFSAFILISMTLPLGPLDSQINTAPLNFTTALFILYSFVSIWLTRNQMASVELHQFLLKSFLGFLYCSIFPSYIIKILLLDSGDFLILSFLCIVFAGDTFAYFGGILFGKNKMMPTLSPKKTLEGSATGLIASMIMGYLILPLQFTPPSQVYLILVLFFVAAIAQTGDLFESMIKRTSDVKDSGQLLPGHGGVLDRLDGVYFSAPIFYLLCYFLTASTKV